MKTYLAAAALAAALSQPAAAVTFPTLTTIYVGSDVTDNGGATNVGIATTFLCSNVSGVTAIVRLLVLGAGGAIDGEHSFTSVEHGNTVVASTHFTASFDESSMATGGISHGVSNIESTQSAVFCTAAIVGAAGEPPTFPCRSISSA